jgi:hypothetical protein
MGENISRPPTNNPKPNTRLLRINTRELTAIILVYWRKELTGPPVGPKGLTDVRKKRKEACGCNIRRRQLEDAAVV